MLRLSMLKRRPSQNYEFTIKNSTKSWAYFGPPLPTLVETGDDMDLKLQLFRGMGSSMFKKLIPSRVFQIHGSSYYLLELKIV